MHMNSYSRIVLKNNIQYLEIKTEKIYAYQLHSCNLYLIVLLILFGMIYK